MSDCCPLGVPVYVLEKRSDWEQIREMMVGQTGAICDGREYDCAAGGYLPSACADNPHGFVVYRHDLRRAGLEVPEDE